MMASSNPHLVPTTVTDKNGKTTTVYRNPGTTQTNTVKLPAPTHSPTLKARKELEHETATALISEIDETSKEDSYQYLLEIFPQYSDETLQRFIETSSTKTGWELTSALINVASTPTENHINDWITIKPLIANHHTNPALIANALPKYKHLAPQDRGHYPPRRTQQVTAITRVTKHFETLNQGLRSEANEQQSIMRIIKDEQLSDFLTTHENPEAIADIIVTRNLIDPEQITALYETMNSTANAISEGSL